MDEMKINYPDSEKTFLLSDKELEGCYLDCRDNYFIGISVLAQLRHTAPHSILRVNAKYSHKF